MPSAAADQNSGQASPGQNQSASVDECMVWRSYTRRPDLVLGISLAAIITLAVLVGFLTGTLSIKTVFARGSTEIIATDPGDQWSSFRRLPRMTRPAPGIPD